MIRRPPRSTLSSSSAASDVYKRQVVPGAVEQNHLAGGRQMFDIPLEVPLRLLAVARSGQGGDAHDARVQVFREALDGATLAGGVAALEDDRDPQALVLDPLLELDELDLQLVELRFVGLALHLLVGRTAGVLGLVGLLLRLGFVGSHRTPSGTGFAVALIIVQGRRQRESARSATAGERAPGVTSRSPRLAL